MPIGAVTHVVARRAGTRATPRVCVAPSGVSAAIFGRSTANSGRPVLGAHQLLDVLDHRRAAVAVEDVGHEHAVAVGRQPAGVGLERGPQPEGVHVEQHRGVRAARRRTGEEGIGGAVGGGHIHSLGDRLIPPLSHNGDGRASTIGHLAIGEAS